MSHDPEVDQTICVDAGRGVVLDGDEGYPVQFSVRALDLCGVEEAKRLQAAEGHQWSRLTNSSSN